MRDAVPAQASDESNATTGKRLATVGIENTEDNRRAWRQLLYSAPGALWNGVLCLGATAHPSACLAARFTAQIAGPVFR